MVMRNKTWAKKIIKFRTQKDWMISITVMTTFCFLKIFGELNWSFIWLISPIWILLSIYAIVTTLAMTWYFGFEKKRRNADNP